MFSLLRMGRAIFALALFGALSLFAGSYALAAPQTVTLHLSPNGADGPDCGSMEAPCRSLQTAIDMASGTTHIKMAEGVYTGSGEILARVESVWDRPLYITVEGGYTDGNWSTPTADPSLTRLDGERTRRVIHVEASGNSANELTLLNLSIVNGFSNVKDAHADWYDGGGFLCRENQDWGQVHVTMRNVVFDNNRVEGRGSGAAIAKGGGASFLYGCRGTLETVTFTNNSVHGGHATDASRGGQAVGGGLFAGNGTILDIRDLTLIDNKVEAGSGGSGRGWDVAGGFGLPDGLGGGAAFQLNTVTIDGVTARGNIALGGAADEMGGVGSGGGLFFELILTTGIVRRGDFRENHAIGGASIRGVGGVSSGGALMSADCPLELSELVMVNNTSIGGAAPDAGDAGGGAMYFTKAKAENVSRVVGTNLIMADNLAEAGVGDKRWGGGGAVFSQDTELILRHTTIVNNKILTSMLGGSAIDVQHNYEESSLQMSDSIVAFNLHADIWNNPRAAIVVHRPGDSAHLDRVLFYQNSADIDKFPGSSEDPIIQVSNSIAPADPKFVSPGAPNFDYRIGLGSAAMDQAAGSTTEIDVDGSPRPFGSAADVGADEYGHALTLSVRSARSETILLSWNYDAALMPGVEGFRITPSQGEAVTLSADARQHQFDTLETGVDYTFVISALNGAGEVITSSQPVNGVLFAEQLFIPQVMR